MMEALLEVAAFAAKATIVVIAVSATSFLVFHLGRGEARDEQHGRLKVSRLDVRLLGLRDALRVRERSKKEWKALRKQREEEADARAEGPTTYLLEFQGDLEPSQARSLSRCVTAICLAAGDGDDVLVRLESPGGTVPGYGLAAAQLQRLKEAGLSLTVCIDRVAASGGYMMAVVADEIVAAPLAVVGSIGVLLPVPNVHRWLKERGVEYDEMTAGEYKRTVSLAGEITPEGRAKTQAQLDETHALFKKHITRHRPALDIESVATGEFWYAERAKELGLVDRIATSDDLLLERASERAVLRVRYLPPPRFAERVLDWSARLARVGRALSSVKFR